MRGGAVGVCVVAGLLLGAVSVARADYVSVYGSPAYDPSTGNGYKGGSASMVNATGTAVARTVKYVGGVSMGDRALRWDGSGGGATELGNLGAESSGYAMARAYAINDAGTAVGWADKISGGNYWGERAVRWDANSVPAYELGSLGMDAGGYTEACAYAVNSAGVAAGWAYKFQQGVCVGPRAVRWDESGIAATELGGLGTDSTGFAWAEAHAINDTGAVVGYARKYDGGNEVGERAVRWDGSGTAATELGDLGTDSSGTTYADARAVNAAGTAVGQAYKYVNGVDKGLRAVRWDASGTAATELGDIGTSGAGTTNAWATAINDAGTAVGSAQKYVGGSSKGFRAVRWDLSGAATELGDLGTDASGYTSASASAIDGSGVVVGYSRKYVGGSNVGDRAVYWGLDGAAVDLNDLIDPDSGWTLTQANSISDTGWIVGSGLYDPDGLGGYDPYNRLFLLQIPEPASASLLLAAFMGLMRRRRHR